MKRTLDEVENAVDEVLAPDRAIRWVVRVVMLIVLLAVGVTVGKIALHMVSKVDQVTVDHDWFVGQGEAIKAAELEATAAAQALERHKKEVKGRSGLFSISRSEDRQETQRLNREILAAQKRRLELIKEYNERAGQVEDLSVLGNLPRHLNLEVTDEQPGQSD